jgi:hypothetical protein
MNIKINGKKYNIKPLSQLSVLEFVQIVDKARYIDLISYMSALTGIEIDSALVKLTKPENIEACERMLLDCDIDFSKITTPNIFEFDNSTYIVNQMDSGIFGNRYVFNLYRRQFDKEQISIVMLCVYALAITLSKGDKYDDIDIIFPKLMRMNWQIVLPVGFFLSKKLSNKRNYLMIFLRKSIISLFYQVKLIKMRVTRMI